MAIHKNTTGVLYIYMMYDDVCILYMCSIENPGKTTKNIQKYSEHYRTKYVVRNNFFP
jgi:hypothetical protein